MRFILNRLSHWVLAALLLTVVSACSTDSDNDADAVDKSELRGAPGSGGDTARDINPQDTMQPTPLEGLGGDTTRAGTMNQDTTGSASRPGSRWPS